MTFSEQQANIEYDPKLQLQVPKEELESLKIENIILDMQLAQIKAEEVLWNVMNALNRARIDQYGYIPDPDPWSDNDL